MRSRRSGLELVHDVLETEDIASVGKSGLIVTLAPWQFWVANRDRTYRFVVESCRAVTVDGRWLQLALKIAGRRHRVITGRSVLQSYFVNRSLTSVALIGGSDNARRVVALRRPEWCVIGGEFDLPVDENRLNSVCETLSSARVTDVFLALGCPKQEIWGAAIVRRLEVRAVGIGGAVEVIGEQRENPSALMQSMRLEWLQRTMQDPRRFLPRVIQAWMCLIVLVFEAVVHRVKRRLGLGLR